MNEPAHGCKGLSPIIGAGPLPVARLDSHVFNVPHNWMADIDSFVEDLSRKVAAESERLLRLVPKPPVGYRWVLTTFRHENLPNNTIDLFVRAELKEIKHEYREETSQSYPQVW